MAMERHRYFLIGLFLIIFSVGSWAEKAEIELYRYLKQGGDLRMTTMRILQEYAMVGTNNRFNNPGTSLQEDMKRLEKGLESLLASLKDDEEKEDFSYQALLRAQENLKTARSLLKEKPSEANAMKFWKEIDGVREGLNRSLVHLSQMVHPDDEIVQGIMYANRLSTIAQRFGALYLYKVWGFKELHAREQLHFLNTFFPDTIENVRESSEDLPKEDRKKVAEQLAAVERNLRFFIIMGKSTRRFIPTLIYSKADKIAKSAGSIVEIFMKQAPSP